MRNLLGLWVAFLLLLGIPLSAVPSRVFYPAQVQGPGAGWSVDQRTGMLSMRFPSVSVPGDMSIPITLRVAGSWQDTYNSLYTWNGHGYTPGSSCLLRYPVMASMHFGYISGVNLGNDPNAGKYFPYGGSTATQSSFVPLQNAWYVLENGNVLSSSDLSSLSSCSLPSYFGFTPSSLSQLQVSPLGDVAVFPAASSDFGSWSSTVQSVAGNAKYYMVVMDRDKARVFAYFDFSKSLLPVFWLDRFGHYARFYWTSTTTGLPAGYSSVTSVKVLNSKVGTPDRGCQVQWAQSTTGDVTDKVLLRMDYIGLQGPVLQVKGYSGASAKLPNNASGMESIPAFQPPSMSGCAFIRPTEVRIGNPSSINIIVPSWMSSGLPQPPVVTGETWPNDRAWSIAYDTNLSEIVSITDQAKQVKTSFEYQTSSISDQYYPSIFRSVTKATSVDLVTNSSWTHLWTWTLPSSGATNWVTTHNQTFSTSGVHSVSVPTQRYTFAPYGDPNFGNGALIKQELLDASGNSHSTVSNTLTLIGVNSTIPAVSTQTIASDNELTKLITQIFGGSYATLSMRKIAISGGSDSNYSSVENFVYDSHPELLDLRRVTSFWKTVIANGVTSNTGYNYITYNASNFSPSSQYVDMGSGSQMGGKTSIDSSGHLTSQNNYSTWSQSGVATTGYTYDDYTGQLKTQKTSFDKPGGSDSCLTTFDSYDGFNRITQTTDPNGVKSTWTYDAFGRTVAATRDGEASQSIAYPDERTCSTTINGYTTTDSYDGFGCLISRKRGSDGVTESYTYDSNGRIYEVVETATTGKTRTSTRLYDLLGRIIEQTTPTNQTIDYTYAVNDASSTSTTCKVTGNDGVVKYSTTERHDVWGRTIQSSDAAGNTTSTQYDAYDHPTQIVVGGSGQTRTYSYNSAGLLTQETNPETGTTTYSSPNAKGLPTSINEAGVRVKSLAYDGLGRVCSIANGSDSATWNYSGLKLMSSARTSGGNTVTTSYSYYPNAKISSETLNEPWNIGGTGWTAGYTYDGIGRLSTITYPQQGHSVTYVPDDTASGYGRTKQVIANGKVIATLGYDAWGNENSITFGSGARQSLDFGDPGLILGSNTIAPVNAVPIKFSYSYDPVNQLTGNGDWVTNHNNLGQLTSVTGYGLSASFAYDQSSNNVTSTYQSAPSNFNSFTLTAPLSNNRIPSGTSNGNYTDWSYNASGEANALTLVTGTSNTLAFGWDGLGTLRTVTNASGATDTYAYSANGLRTFTTNNSDASKNRSYFYSSSGALLAEYTGSGSSWNWKRDVIYQGGHAIAEMDANGIHELHCNEQGTPRVITNGTTGLQEGTLVYGPYGELLASSTSGYYPLTSYTGHIQTEPNGLIYMRGRFYSPAWHCFINSDKGADSGQLNQYAYCSGSPMMAYDPTGMWSLSSLWGDLKNGVHQFGHAMGVNWDHGGRDYAVLAAQIAFAYLTGDGVDTACDGDVTGAMAGGAAAGAVSANLSNGSPQDIIEASVLGAAMAGLGYEMFAPTGTEIQIAGIGDAQQNAIVEVRDKYHFADRVSQGIAWCGGVTSKIARGFGAGYYAGAQVEALRAAHSRGVGIMEFIGTDANGRLAGPNFNGILTKADTGNPAGIGLNAGGGCGLVVTNATNVSQMYGTVLTTNISFGPIGATFGKDASGIWTGTLGISKGWGVGVTRYNVTTW